MLLDQILISPRENNWDADLVEPGPEPQKLSSGNYLFLYNSAHKVDTPNPKPDWNLEFNIGYVILDGNDPTKVLYRSRNPLISPEHAWEKAVDVKGKTPLKVYTTGRVYMLMINK